jgi:deoxyribodipyrimidine photo-lyase
MSYKGVSSPWRTLKCLIRNEQFLKISLMIQPERIKPLNNTKPQKGKYVLYWMQASQRAAYNHALEYAVREANEQKKPVIAAFGLTDRFPDANSRHYGFMLEGLKEVQQALKARGIQLVVQQRSPEIVATELSKNASLAVTDRGCLRIQKAWRRHVAKKARCPVVQVESDVVVPVDTAYPKEAYSAGVLRPKIQSHWKRYLVPLKETRPTYDSLGLQFDSLDLGDPEAVLSTLRLDRSVCPVQAFQGGTSIAIAHLEAFIEDKLKHYHEMRSDPGLDLGSHMSPYLHFGQISPLYIALQVSHARGKPRQAKDAYLEELIVRRELSMNFVRYNPHYDTFQALPGWAKKTLRQHQKDRRGYLYSPEEMEQARTHDPYWNAAQKEMLFTGTMHNYMRMYWGKKILEWSETPENAYATALYLNNKYELDGRDPNGFAGVAWCFGKHDRAWNERPIFGKVRYMNAAGLERKFDMSRYVKRIETLGTTV